MKRRVFVTGGVSAVALAAQAQVADRVQRREFVAPHMGTMWRLVFFENDTGRAHTARDAAWARLAELDARLSDYRDDSEVSRLLRFGRLEAPSHDVRRVLVAARGWSEATAGAFDVTVGPLVQLWRTARKERRLPDAAAVTAAQKLVDWRAVEVSEAAVIFRTGGGRIDLGGIGKGYAQDEVLRLLRESHELDAVLIDAGGGVAVGAPPPGEVGWRAMIDPGDEEVAPATVALVRQSLATSGDTNQFVEIDGVRYAHIVDPATGHGLTRRVQASVVASDATSADALATAFCVMEESAVREFLRHSPRGEARLRSLTADGRSRVWESRGFARLARGG